MSVSVDPSTMGDLISIVEMGDFQFEAWYPMAFPSLVGCTKVFVCHFCLVFFPTAESFHTHRRVCPLVCPPGKEIYREDRMEGGSLAVFEVDGNQWTSYCQNACLLGRLFLNEKRENYRVNDFMFYILVHFDCFEFYGFFSKVSLIFVYLFLIFFLGKTFFQKLQFIMPGGLTTVSPAWLWQFPSFVIL